MIQKFQNKMLMSIVNVLREKRELHENLGVKMVADVTKEFTEKHKHSVITVSASR